MTQGLLVVSKERLEQLHKHGRTVQSDVQHNDKKQLAHAASLLAAEEVNLFDVPYHWDTTIWNRMIEKPYAERIKIAAALLVAEVDRLIEIGELVPDLSN
jgi:hypothetical protein